MIIDNKGNKKKRFKILLSVYSCAPNHGSEPEIGWKRVLYLNKYCDLIVLTTSKNRNPIEQYYNSINKKNVQFIYFDIPLCFKIFLRFLPMGGLLYYYFWQYFVYRFVKRKKIYRQIDLIHHITYCQLFSPGFWYKLNTPYILGPLGGTATVPKQFYTILHWSERLQETARRIVKNYFIQNKTLIHYFKNSRKVFFANKEIKNFFNISSDVLLDVAADKNKIRRKKYFLNKKQFNIIWVGLLTYRKALILLLQAMNKLKDQEIFLDIYGSGKKLSEYKNYLEKYNLNSKVRLKGRIPRNELLKRYHKYDIFVFTSLRDTGGTVNLEAMTNGLPVIFVNHQGIKDIMETGNCGIAIEPKNPEYVVDKLVKAILYYKNNPKKIKEHGLNAQKRIEDKYTWERTTKQIYKSYEEVIRK